jgi:hypothetical protein
MTAIRFKAVFHHGEFVGVVTSNANERAWRTAYPNSEFRDAITLPLDATSPHSTADDPHETSS